MSDWLHILYRAGSDTVNFIIEGGYMAALVIFLIAAVLTRFFRGKDTVKEWLIDGTIGFFSTAIFILFYFIAHVLFISPVEIIRERDGFITEQSNMINQIAIDLKKKTNTSVPIPINVTVSSTTGGDIFESKTITNFNGTNVVLDHQP